MKFLILRVFCNYLNKMYEKVTKYSNIFMMFTKCLYRFLMKNIGSL